MKLSQLKVNPDNPRFIKDDRFEKLKDSIKEFPKMLKLRPIIYDKDSFEVLGGNMRLKALQELGHTEIPDDWVKSSEDLTDKEKERFIVVDNLGFGEWDFDLLANQWEMDDLIDWGVDFLPDMDPESDSDETEEFRAVRQIIVTCESDLQLNEVYNELKDRGIQVKVKGAKSE